MTRCKIRCLEHVIINNKQLLVHSSASGIAISSVAEKKEQRRSVDKWHETSSCIEELPVRSICALWHGPIAAAGTDTQQPNSRRRRQRQRQGGRSGRGRVEPSIRVLTVSRQWVSGPPLLAVLLTSPARSSVVLVHTSRVYKESTPLNAIECHHTNVSTFHYNYEYIASTYNSMGVRYVFSEFNL